MDLRNNPGGYLSVAQDVGGWFLEKNEVIAIEDFGDDRDDKKYKSKGPGTFSDLPVVVLINQGSASASEILTGAIKDLSVGTIIGHKTFGKGIVQSVIEVGDGTAYKLTTSQYFTPNGNYIHDKGIKPDKTIIMFCKTSIRAAQTYVALYNAGYRDLKIYDGAWVEWSADSSLPVETPSGKEAESNFQDGS